MLRYKYGSSALRLATGILSRFKFNSKSEVKEYHTQMNIFLSAFPTWKEGYFSVMFSIPVYEMGFIFRVLMKPIHGKVVSNKKDYIRSFPKRPISSSFTTLLVHFFLRAFAICSYDMECPLPGLLLTKSYFEFQRHLPKHYLCRHQPAFPLWPPLKYAQIYLLQQMISHDKTFSAEKS